MTVEELYKRLGKLMEEDARWKSKLVLVSMIVDDAGNEFTSRCEGVNIMKGGIILHD